MFNASNVSNSSSIRFFQTSYPFVHDTINNSVKLNASMPELDKYLKDNQNLIKTSLEAKLNQIIQYSELYDANYSREIWKSGKSKPITYSSIDNNSANWSYLNASESIYPAYKVEFSNISEDNESYISDLDNIPKKFSMFYIIRGVPVRLNGFQTSSGAAVYRAPTLAYFENFSNIADSIEKCVFENKTEATPTIYTGTDSKFEGNTSFFNSASNLSGLSNFSSNILKAYYYKQPSSTEETNIEEDQTI